MSSESPELSDRANSQPPPRWMRQGSSSGADAARAHLASKRPFLALPRLRRPKSSSSSARESVSSPVQTEDARPLRAQSLPPEGEVSLTVSHPVDDDAAQDVYRWAILYENQRGMTILSTPYYSRLSLLPTDPPPFTIPEASSDSSKQPYVSLDEYPLPDGNWRWVSTSWMIDMRGDGEVQYDGFEYNWFFRRKKWRAEVGTLSAGAWVRRRRWVRLMVCPAKKKKAMAQQDHGLGGDVMLPGEGGVETPLNSHPPSVLDMFPTDGEEEWRYIWSKTDPDEDWSRCQATMRLLGRDGRKLEAWKEWLGQENDTAVPRKQQWTEDETPAPSAVDFAASSVNAVEASVRNRIAAVISRHGNDILRGFVYPESRAEFLETLAIAGLLPELRDGLGLSDDAEMVEFQSHIDLLQKALEKANNPDQDN